MSWIFNIPNKSCYKHIFYNLIIEFLATNLVLFENVNTVNAYFGLKKINISENIPVHKINVLNENKIFFVVVKYLKKNAITQKDFSKVLYLKPILIIMKKLEFYLIL